MSRRGSGRTTGRRRRKGDEDGPSGRGPTPENGSHALASVGLEALLIRANRYPEVPRLRSLAASRLRAVQATHGNQYVQRAVKRAFEKDGSERPAEPASQTSDVRSAGLAIAGNGRRAVPPRSLHRAPATATKVAGAEPAAASGKPPDATATIKKDYPHLAKVLSADQVEQVQKVFNARSKAKELEKEWQKYAGRIESDIVRRREAVEKKIHAQGAIIHKNKYLVVPTEELLSDEILPKKDDRPKVAAFKENFYKRLISYPVIVEARTGWPLFSFTWGPSKWGMHQSGGLIRKQDLMRIQKFYVAYQSVLTSEAAKVTEKMAEVRRKMGGKLHNMTGKKVGEIWGTMWNTSVKVGPELGSLSGYYTDKRGEAEMYSEMIRHTKKAKIVLKAPDNWYHIYELTPKFDSWKLKSPDNDGYAYLLAKGSEVSGVHLIETSDSIVLQRGTNRRAGSGWRCKDSPDKPGAFAEFAMGAIFGDALTDPTAASTVGQIFIGMIPIVGQIADARDVAIGIHKIWKTGGKDGKLQTGLALVGLIPLVGDVIKSAAKAGGKKAVASALKGAAPDIESALAKRLLDSPQAVAKRFGVTGVQAKAAKTLFEGAERAARAGNLTAYVRRMAKAHKELGGNAAALVRVSGGNWQKVAKQLAKASKDGVKGADELIKGMQAWRKNHFWQMKLALEKEMSLLQAPGTTKRVGRPQAKFTGTDSITSDLDMSFTGANSSAYRTAAIRRMEAQFGSDWRKLLDADIFADPSRLHMFEGVPSLTGAAKGAERRLVKESELNILAKMMRSGVPASEVRAYAKNIGVSLPAVKARAAEIAALARPIERVRTLEKHVAEVSAALSKATTDAEKKIWTRTLAATEKKLDAAKNALNSSNYRKLQLKLDVLHAKFDAAKTGSVKVTIAEEMAVIQSKLNAAVAGPYVTPGGAFKHVSRREAALRKGKPFTPMSPRMKYMAVLDDLYMLEATRAAVASKGFNEKAAKSLAKYAERLLMTARQHGVEIGKASRARELFDKISDSLAVARADPTKLVGIPAFRKNLDEAMNLLEGQLNDLLTAVAKKVPKEGQAVKRMLIVLGKLAKIAKIKEKSRERRGAVK